MKLFSVRYVLVPVGPVDISVSFCPWDITATLRRRESVSVNHLTISLLLPLLQVQVKDVDINDSSDIKDGIVVSAQTKFSACLVRGKFLNLHAQVLGLGLSVAYQWDW